MLCPANQLSVQALCRADQVLQPHRTLDAGTSVSNKSSLSMDPWGHSALQPLLAAAGEVGLTPSDGAMAVPEAVVPARGLPAILANSSQEPRAGALCQVQVQYICVAASARGNPLLALQPHLLLVLASHQVLSV